MNSGRSMQAADVAWCGVFELPAEIRVTEIELGEGLG